jgi:hypothetical protein
VGQRGELERRNGVIMQWHLRCIFVPLRCLIQHSKLLIQIRVHKLITFIITFHILIEFFFFGRPRVTKFSPFGKIIVSIYCTRRFKSTLDKSGMEDSLSYPFQLHIYPQTHCEDSALIVPGLYLMTQWPLGLEKCGLRFVIQVNEPFSVSGRPIRQVPRPPTEAHRIRCVFFFSNCITCE